MTFLRKAFLSITILVALVISTVLCIPCAMLCLPAIGINWTMGLVDQLIDRMKCEEKV